jgi:hypothetical protein
VSPDFFFPQPISAMPSATKTIAVAPTTRQPFAWVGNSRDLNINPPALNNQHSQNEGDYDNNPWSVFTGTIGMRIPLQFPPSGLKSPNFD